MKVFISYCHADEDYRIELNKYLSILKKEKKIDNWCDREILPGGVLSDEIKSELDKSDIIIGLVSQDYLSSTACEEEVQFAIEKGKRFIPIIIRECLWLETELKQFLALPTDGKPVSLWEHKESAWVNIGEGLIKLVNSLSCQFKKTYVDNINITEFVGSNKEHIKLSDIFVIPEIEYIQIDGKTKKRRFDFNKLVDDGKKLFVIHGNEKTGKTCLLYHIFMSLCSNENKFFPVLIDGASIHKKKNYEDEIQKALNIQYVNLSLQEFSRKQNRVLLVDNYTHSISDSFVNWAKSFFDYIFISFDTNEYFVYYSDNSIIADFDVIRLLELNSVGRYELIKKWKYLTSDNYETPEENQIIIDNLEREVCSIITEKNIVPSTPFYILTILQSRELFMPYQYTITAYGYCYSAIFFAQLANVGLSSSDDFDASQNFFTALGGYIFENGKPGNWSISEEKYEDFKETYLKEFVISKSLINRIEAYNCRILNIYENKVMFHYKYMFYYFSSKYLVENKKYEEIEAICSKIYLKDYSYIIIFTLHHTNDIKILEEIETHCICSLDSYPIATLSREETQFMDDLLDFLPKQIEIEMAENDQFDNIQRNRLAYRERQDIINDVKNVANDDIEEIPDETSPELIELEKAMRIVEVLGQIAKNRYGSLKKKNIKEILLEIEELEFRLLSFFMSFVNDNSLKEWLYKRIEAIQKEKKYLLKEEEIKKLIKQNIDALGMTFVLVSFMQIYNSVASEKFIDLQMEISESKNTISFDFVNILFHINLKGLNYNEIKKYHDKFSNINPWAVKVLGIIIADYLDHHNVYFRDRQRFADLFGFKYKPNRIIK